MFLLIGLFLIFAVGLMIGIVVIDTVMEFYISLAARSFNKALEVKDKWDDEG